MKGSSSAVNEKIFKYLLAEEPTSRILKSKFQDTEVGLESDYSLSRAAAFALHGMVGVLYMYIFHFYHSDVHRGVHKVLHKRDIIDV